LASGILDIIREYYKKEKPQKWLFEDLKENQYSATNILNDIKNAALRAGTKSGYILICCGIVVLLTILSKVHI